MNICIFNSCSYYLLTFIGPGEVPAGGRRGEEVDVPGGMPPAVPALLPLCRLGGWTLGAGGDGNLEEVS